MASAEGLNFTFVVINCFFNAFLSFTAIVRIKHHNHASAQKNVVVAYDFKNIATKLGCV